jgi:hypothetical protein
MPAPITEFVDVTINVQGATPEKFQFGSLLGAFTHSVTANISRSPRSQKSTRGPQRRSRKKTGSSQFSWVGSTQVMQR